MEYAGLSAARALPLHSTADTLSWLLLLQCLLVLLSATASALVHAVYQQLLLHAVCAHL
jgi:hypothetical protein